jgi:hypothetical protein
MSGRRLYVGRVSQDATRKDLESYFGTHGPIVDVRLMGGFAFLEYEQLKVRDQPSDATSIVEAGRTRRGNAFENWVMSGFWCGRGQQGNEQTKADSDQPNYFVISQDAEQAQADFNGKDFMGDR